MPTIKAKVDGNWVTMGGVGPGVKPGGTQNQILSKTSAADYDTQWTSAPVLTGLTMNGTAGSTVMTLNNDNWIQFKDTGGVPRYGLGMSNNGNIYLGDNEAATIVGIMSGSQIQLVAPTIEVTGTLNSRHAVRAAALVNGDNGSTGSGFGFASGQLVSTGLYRLTLSSAYSSIVPMACGWHNSQPVSCVVQVLSGTQFEVRTYTSATMTLSNNYFVVYVIAW